MLKVNKITIFYFLDKVFFIFKNLKNNKGNLNLLTFIILAMSKMNTKKSFWVMIGKVGFMPF
jgi:hypothetical protein